MAKTNGSSSTETDEATSNDPPPNTPGENNPDERYIAWALVAMVFLAVFIWPLAFSHRIPPGTVAALITAITTLFVARRVKA